MPWTLPRPGHISVVGRGQGQQPRLDHSNRRAEPTDPRQGGSPHHRCEVATPPAQGKGHSQPTDQSRCQPAAGSCLRSRPSTSPDSRDAWFHFRAPRAAAPADQWPLDRGAGLQCPSFVAPQRCLCPSQGVSARLSRSPASLPGEAPPGAFHGPGCPWWAQGSGERGLAPHWGQREICGQWPPGCPSGHKRSLPSSRDLGGYRCASLGRLCLADPREAWGRPAGFCCAARPRAPGGRRSGCGAREQLEGSSVGKTRLAGLVHTLLRLRRALGSAGCGCAEGPLPLRPRWEPDAHSLPGLRPRRRPTEQQC